MLTSIFKAQIAALSLTLSLAEMDTKDYELIPPEPIRNVAKRGLALHQKFGKGKNAVLAEAIASEKSLSSKDIEKMLEFFNQFTPDRELKRCWKAIYRQILTSQIRYNFYTTVVIKISQNLELQIFMFGLIVIPLFEISRWVGKIIVEVGE